MIASGQNVKRLLDFGARGPSRPAQVAVLRQPETDHPGFHRVRAHQREMHLAPNGTFFNRLTPPLQHQLDSFVAGPGRSSSPRARRMRLHRPCLTHSSWRRYAVSHLPYSLGISRQEEPVLATHRMPPSTTRWSFGGLPTPPFCGGNNVRTDAHCSSVSLASSGAIVVIAGGLSLRSATLAARQRAAAAWCARLHADHPKRKRLRRFGAAIARTSLLASGTVGGIRPRSRPPFYRLCRRHLLRRGRRCGRPPGRRGRAGKG